MQEHDLSSSPSHKDRQGHRECHENYCPKCHNPIMGGGILSLPTYFHLENPNSLSALREEEEERRRMSRKEQNDKCEK